MYQPLFKEERLELLQGLIRSYPLGTCVSLNDGVLNADHLPMVLHCDRTSNGVLQAHVHKGNPLWAAADQVSSMMTIFQGPQAYVSPSWYPSKKEHGKVVPTWNYICVHVRGSFRFIEDEDWLMAHLVDLTERQENSREEPWGLNDAPSDFIHRQLRGIVGIEIEIESLEGTWKTSQNRSEADQTGVKDGLLSEAHGSAIDLANRMKGFV